MGRELAEQGFLAVAWGQPGHGDGHGATDLPDMAAVADSVASRFLPLAGVVCSSFGAAATLAARARHPRLEIPRIALVAPAAILHRSEFHTTRGLGHSGTLWDPEILRRIAGFFRADVPLSADLEGPDELGGRRGVRGRTTPP